MTSLNTFLFMFKNILIWLNNYIFHKIVDGQYNFEKVYAFTISKNNDFCNNVNIHIDLFYSCR